MNNWQSNVAQIESVFENTPSGVKESRQVRFLKDCSILGNNFMQLNNYEDQLRGWLERKSIDETTFNLRMKNSISMIETLDVVVPPLTLISHFLSIPPVKSLVRVPLPHATSNGYINDVLSVCLSKKTGKPYVLVKYDLAMAKGDVIHLRSVKANILNNPNLSQEKKDETIKKFTIPGSTEMWLKYTGHILTH